MTEINAFLAGVLVGLGAREWWRPKLPALRSSAAAPPRLSAAPPRNPPEASRLPKPQRSRRERQG